MPTVELRRIEVLDDTIEPLIVEADAGGHRFVRRLRDDWLSGANRFDKKGEFLLAAFTEGRLVAVGGLNIDPYAGSVTIGRVRHLYVARSARRLGVGTTLVRRIVADATPYFAVLRLRTDTAEAAAFYERLGFQRTREPAATHIIAL